jgi:hypothetical protein
MLFGQKGLYFSLFVCNILKCAQIKSFTGINDVPPEGKDKKCRKREVLAFFTNYGDTCQSNSLS